MEEIKNKEYYEKLSKKKKNRFSKLYLKYKNDEEKVIRMMNYEKKIQLIEIPCSVIGAYIINLPFKNLNEFYLNGGFFGLEYILLFIVITIPTGMGLYKYLYISREINRIVSILISIILSFIVSGIGISIIEKFILTVTTM